MKFKHNILNNYNVKISTISENMQDFLIFGIKKMWFKDLGTDIFLNIWDRKIQKKESATGTFVPYSIQATKRVKLKILFLPSTKG